MTSSTGVSSINTLTGAVTLPRGGQFFTSSGTFTVPAGVTRVRVKAVGGGGGSAGGSITTAGGNSSAGSVIAYGGGAGNSVDGGTGGGYLGLTAAQGYFNFGGYGIGGVNGCFGNGGNGGAVVGVTTTTPGGTLSVTVGAGGISGGIYNPGPNGTQGYVLLEY